MGMIKVIYSKRRKKKWQKKLSLVRFADMFTQEMLPRTFALSAE